MAQETSNLNRKILEKKIMEKENAMAEHSEELREELTELEQFEENAEAAGETREVDEMVLEEYVAAENEIKAEAEDEPVVEQIDEIPAETADLSQEAPAEEAAVEAVSPQAEELDLDRMQEENRKQKEDLEKLKKAAGIKEKKPRKPLKIAAVVLALLLVAFAVYKLLPSGNTFEQAVQIGDTIEGEKTRCAVRDIVVIDKLLENKAAEGKTFICVSYQYKNISQEEITWKDFPLLNVCGYESDEPGHRPKLVIGNSEVNKRALQSYSYISGTDLEMAKDNLKPNETRYDIDVFEVDETVFDKYSLYVTFDSYDSAVKIDRATMNKLPSMKETIKQQQKKK